MNFNFKNLSENTKRIRIIPKNGTELFANIGVDNPTATIDEDGVFSVCLSPYEVPEYGDWIINQDYEIVGYDIKYTAYKTNSLDYYDSFALAYLNQALVNSFHDSDLQQYAAFTTAVEQLTGATDWVLDPANNQIRYTKPENNDPTLPPNVPYVYHFSISGVKQYYSTFNAAALADADYFISDYNSRYPSRQLSYLSHTVPTWQETEVTSKNYVVTVSASSGKNPDTYTRTVTRAINPGYDPTQEEEQEKTLPLDEVAQKVISNAKSSENEVLKLLSEDYITLVAESIFNTDTNRQFVTLEDLESQLEANKVLRN